MEPGLNVWSSYLPKEEVLLLLAGICTPPQQVYHWMSGVAVKTIPRSLMAIVVTKMVIEHNVPCQVLF